LRHLSRDSGMIERMNTTKKPHVFIVRTQQFIERKRAAYLKLPRLVQLLAILFTFFVGFIGLTIILLLPEIGAPLLLGSLGVLSFEFKWAERLLLRVVQLFGSKAFMSVLALIAFAVVIILALVWFNR